MKENITELNKQTEEGMNKLLEEFEQWYDDTFDALEKQVEQEDEVRLITDEDRDAFYNAKSKADKLHKKTATVTKRKWIYRLNKG